MAAATNRVQLVCTAKTYPIGQDKIMTLEVYLISVATFFACFSGIGLAELVWQRRLVKREKLRANKLEDELDELHAVNVVLIRQLAEEKVKTSN